MTRINCIPPKELTDKHLLAEYRELPRVFKLARVDHGAPSEYTLGKGHVRFFYNKLTYLVNRQAQLIREMKVRGFNPRYDNPCDLIVNKPSELCNDWVPTTAAKRINRERIRERLTSPRSSKTI